MLLAGREIHDVAGPHLLYRTALALNAAKSEGDDDRLAERVRVPRGARAWLEGDRRAAQGTAALERGIDPNCAGELFLRPLARRL
jgi:hypothetical protein